MAQAGAGGADGRGGVGVSDFGSPLYSRTVYETDLYVLQNEFGLIKIGKSVNPEKRRQELQSNEKCTIELVLLLPGKGEREKTIHRKLEEYHIEGEWFCGTEEARAAICKVVNRGITIDWPFKLDAIACERWLEQFFDLREQRLNLKEFGKHLRRLENESHSTWTADGDLWIMFWISETGERPLVDVSEENGEVVLDGYLSNSPEPIRIPKYTSHIGAAMTLWPVEFRPSAWKGTVWECCIAAMKLRFRLMPRNWKGEAS